MRNRRYANWSLSPVTDISIYLFSNISNIKNDCFYSAILENNGKLLLGLASNKTYESINKIDFIKINNKLKKNSFFILDLCFNRELTEKIINYYSKKRINIFVAGTSSFKIYRIKKGGQIDPLFNLSHYIKSNRSSQY